MIKTFNTFPVGSLPYNDEQSPTNMMVKIFEKLHSISVR